MTLENRLAYYSRSAWVNFKKSFWLPVKSDKKYFCEKIVRGMISGEINRDTIFTNTLMGGEGIGSQVMSRLSVEYTSTALGYKYCYTPLFDVGHPDGDCATWSKRCEDRFGLGFRRLNVAETGLEPVNFIDYCQNKAMWGRKHLVCVRDFYSFTDTKIDSFHDFIQQKRLTSNFNYENKDDKFRIAMHARRGDVSYVNNKGRFTPNSAIIDTISKIRKFANSQNLNYEINLYTNGSDDDMMDIKSIGINIYNKLPALETLCMLINSDILVTTKSTFSYMAGMISNGLVFYENYTHPAPKKWIKLDSDGSFDAGAASKYILKIC